MNGPSYQEWLDKVVVAAHRHRLRPLWVRLARLMPARFAPRACLRDSDRLVAYYYFAFYRQHKEWAQGLALLDRLPASPPGVQPVYCGRCPACSGE